MQTTQVPLSKAAEMAMVDEYGIRQVSDATAKWFSYSVERLARHCGMLLAGDVRPADVAGWVAAERKGDASPVTVNSYLRGVKTVFGRLVRRGLLAENPAAPVAFLKEPAARPKAISLADYMRLRNAAATARDLAIVDVLWSSGVRLGGLLSMRVDRMEHWTTASGRHCYAFSITEKGDKPLVAYVGHDRREGDSLAAWLEERPKADSSALWLTLRNPRRPIDRETVESLFRKLRQQAGIPSGRPANPHSFRHAFALRMLDSGHDIAAVSEWLGHYSASFTAERYSVRTEEALRKKYFGQVLDLELQDEVDGLG